MLLGAKIHPNTTPPTGRAPHIMPLFFPPPDDECARMRSEYVACVVTPYASCHAIVDKYLKCTAQRKKAGGD